MNKIVKCGLVVCAVGAVVLVISGCNDANGVFKGEEKRLVEASLGGSERSVRGKRSVASGHASAQAAYYESKFRIKLGKKHMIAQKCLALNGEGELERVACTEGYDANQIWYFDYEGNIFSLSGGEKACLYKDVRMGGSILKPVHYEVLLINAAACGKQSFKAQRDLFQVKVERDEKGDLYITTIRRHDEQGKVLFPSELKKNREVNKAYLGFRYGELVFDNDQRYRFSVEFEEVSDEEVSPVYKDFEDYYVNFVVSEEKQLPFFTQRETGKHAYIGKEVLIHDLYQYRIAYYKERVNVRNRGGVKEAGIPPAIEVLIGAGKIVMPSKRKKWKLLKEQVIELGTKLEDLSAPKVGVLEVLIMCMYNAEGEVVGGRCTAWSEKVVGNYDRAMSRKPEGYYYEGLDASKVAVTNAKYNINDDLYRVYSGGGEKIYINANQFWHALNVVMPGEKVKWELETKYLPGGALAQEGNNVAMMLPLYMDDVGMRGGYRTGEQIMHKVKVVSTEGGAELGVVKVAYTNEGTWDGRDYTPPEAESAQVRYEFKGKVIAERNMPLVKGKLQTLPVLLLFVDLKAKKLLTQLGEVSWDWGVGPRISLDANDGKVVSLSGLSEAGFTSLSGGVKFEGEGKQGLQFFMPEFMRNVEYSLQGYDEGQSRQRRWELFSSLLRFGAHGASVRYLGGKVYARLGYVAQGAMRVSKMMRLKHFVKRNFTRIMNHPKRVATFIVGGGGAIGLVAASFSGAFTSGHGKGEAKKQLHPRLSRDAKAVLLRRNAVESYRADGKTKVRSKQPWNELCAIGGGNDTSCVNGEVAVSGSYEEKSVNYKAVYTRKHDNTKEKRVDKNVSLACFHKMEKFDGQVYNYMCVTDEKPTRVYTTVKPGDMATKQKIKGNAMYLFVDKKNSLDDVNVYVRRTEKIEREGGIGLEEYLLIAKLPSVLTAKKNSIMHILGVHGNETVIAQMLQNGNIFIFPLERKEMYKDKISLHNGMLSYQDKKRSTHVWFRCPDAVTAGSIYRCTASKKGEYRVLVLASDIPNEVIAGTRDLTDEEALAIDGILKQPATSDGITNPTMQLYPPSLAFGPGTAYSKGSEKHKYIETDETPHSFVDVKFANVPQLSMVEFQTKTQSGKTIIITEPVGVVQVVFDRPKFQVLKDVRNNSRAWTTFSIDGKEYFNIDNGIEISGTAISFADNVKLISPEEFPESLKYIRVGFVQTVRAERYGINLYNNVLNKRYAFQFDILSNNNEKKFKQHGDTEPRVYPYVYDTSYTSDESDNLTGMLALTSRSTMKPDIFERIRRGYPALFGDFSLRFTNILRKGFPTLGADDIVTIVGHREVDRLLILHYPWFGTTNWITDVNASIAGARPYMYKHVFEFDTHLVASVVSKELSSINLLLHSFQKNSDMVDGIYTVLDKITWSVVQEVGYSNVEDIGHVNRSKLLYYHFLVKDAESSDMWNVLSAGNFKDYYGVERKGQRVLYYKKDITAARTTEPHLFPTLKDSTYIREHMTEFSDTHSQ